jgi:hypothetical protein
MGAWNCGHGGKSLPDSNFLKFTSSSQAMAGSWMKGGLDMA